MASVLPDVQLASAAMRFALGERDDAVPELEGGMQFARERGNMAALAKARGFLVLHAVARGDRSHAQRQLDSTEAIGALQQPGFFGGVVGYARAALMDHNGQPEAAFVELLARPSQPR
jgi:hypothetical protein